MEIAPSKIDANTSTDEDKELPPKRLKEVVEVDSNPVMYGRGGKIYMFFVLLVIMLQRTASQWQRKSLTYAYGFEGIGSQLGNPIYEMTSSYPELS